MHRREQPDRFAAQAYERQRFQYALLKCSSRITFSRLQFHEQRPNGMLEHPARPDHNPRFTGAWIMADSEDSTTPPAISWRAILRGTGALPPAKKTGGAPSDPALQLWRNWQANHTQVVALTRQWQRIEKKLIHSVGIPEVAIRLSGEAEPKIAQSVDEIEELVANEPAIEREALIAAFDEQQKRWNEAAATLGFDAVDAALRAALGKERDFVASVPKTKAASLPGVAAKLAILIQLGEPSPTDAEFPWPELRSALADIARLASPEAAVSPM
ncbi:MAG TPA: hypothetical protein VIF40_13955 [Methylosinus sp.]|jgi:hypothetical protein|uniref:hypothetical protein n=1 Tax=Methylosinus sp. TaxID=427 RepID=UPI002F9353EF